MSFILRNIISLFLPVAPLVLYAVLSLSPIHSLMAQSLQIGVNEQSVMKKTAEALIKNYYSGLNNVAKGDKAEKQLFAEDLLKNVFWGESVRVYNDLYSGGVLDYRAGDYLQAISTLYPSAAGVDFSFELIKETGPYRGIDEKYSFYIIRVKRTLIGIDNNRISRNKQELLDFYVRFEYKNGSWEFDPRIYSIDKATEGIEKRYQLISINDGWAKEGKLQIYLTPNTAAVYINNEKVNQNFPALLSLPEGTVSIRVLSDGFQQYDTIVQVISGITTTLVIELPRNMSLLKIVSNPPKAEIYIDSIYRGKTNLSLSVPNGSGTVLGRKTGYRDAAVSYTLANGETSTVRVNLKPDKFTVNKILKWSSLSVSISALAVGGYFLYSSISNYKKYPDATTDAEKIRRNTQLADKLYPSFFSLGGALVLPTIILRTKPKNHN
jgi:hypothetical protein